MTGFSQRNAVRLSVNTPVPKDGKIAVAQNHPTPRLDRDHMTSMISWASMSDMDLPPAELAVFFNRPLPLDRRKAAEVWAGVNGYAPHEKFILYLKETGKGRKTEREAVLFAEDTSSSETGQPLELTQDHIADAACFLGFRWFNWMPTGTRGWAFISEEPEPIEGMDPIFKGAE